ncbi:unnamed protein product [Merluccius merluccius]
MSPVACQHGVSQGLQTPPQTSGATQTACHPHPAGRVLPLRPPKMQAAGCCSRHGKPRRKCHAGLCCVRCAATSGFTAPLASAISWL